MTKRAPGGMAVCDDCDWTAEGSTRFHDAVAHREATGHNTATSLSDAPGDDTGKQVSDAFHAVRWSLRQ